MNGTTFNTKIDELWTKTKTGELRNRQARFAAIERLTDDYISATGKRPEPAQLDRLATLCLYEEMTDTDRMKMRNNEFPIMSDEQYARRTMGKHKRADDNASVEVSFTAAATVGVDGANYRQPKRK